MLLNRRKITDLGFSGGMDRKLQGRKQVLLHISFHTEFSLPIEKCLLALFGNIYVRFTHPSLCLFLKSQSSFVQ
jgi:hypothetical protein